MTIPKIIHQVWEGKDGQPIPQLFLSMAEKWKKNHPAWEYRFWNGEKIQQLINKYPYLIDKYNSYCYDVQRWDAIRYLILYTYGGLYVDFDYDCLKAVDPLLEDQSCCFGEEPLIHKLSFNLDCYVGNAFMASVPEHPFFKTILDELLVCQSNAPDKFLYILETTGPHLITRLYKNYNRREEITLLSDQKIAPLSKLEVQQIIAGGMSNEIKTKIHDAYAVHCFLGTWQD